MRLALSMVALLFVATTAAADGISVTPDKRHARGDHTVINLTKKQVRDVERARKVTLNGRQHALLQKMNANFPAALKVLTSRWDDCTCGLGAYAIWCRIGELDVPADVVKYYEKPEDEPDNETAADDRRTLKIVMDSRGKMYVKGKAVAENDIRRLGDKLQAARREGRVFKRYIVVDTPPPIDERVDRQVSSILERLNEYSKQKEINFHAIGFSFANGR